MITKVIRLTASWCAPCKMQSKIMEDVVTTVPVEVIDVDVNPELAQEFGIRGVPTMIAYDGAAEVYRVSGVLSKEQLTKFFEGTYAKG